MTIYLTFTTVLAIKALWLKNSSNWLSWIFLYTINYTLRLSIPRIDKPEKHAECYRWWKLVQLEDVKTWMGETLARIIWSSSPHSRFAPTFRSPQRQRDTRFGGGYHFLLSIITILLFRTVESIFCTDGMTFLPRHRTEGAVKCHTFFAEVGHRCLQGWRVTCGCLDKRARGEIRVETATKMYDV